MQTYSDTAKLKYYGNRTTDKSISKNQRKYAKERHGTLKDSVVPTFFRKFALKSVQTNSGTLMSIANVIDTLRSKKDINVRGMSREKEPSSRRIKNNKLYDEDLKRLDLFMIKNKLTSNDSLYFKN